MATTFELRSAPIQKALAIREDCVMSEIGATIGRLLPEVYRWAYEHGVPVVGPAFARYVEWQKDRCVIEVGFVVERAANAGDPRVREVELGGGQAAYALHVGPYEKLAETYGEMDRWIKAQGLSPAATMWENYLDPPEVPTSEQRTELWWPVVSEAATRRQSVSIS